MTSHGDGAGPAKHGPHTEALEEGEAKATSSEDGVFLSWAGRKGFRAAVPTPRVFVPVPEASDPTDEDPGFFLI